MSKMKSSLLSFLVLVFILGLGCPRAYAGGLIYDNSCMTPEMGTKGDSLFAPEAAMGMSCQDIRQYKEGVDLILIALMPLEVAMRTPQAKEMLAAGLAELGLTMANPPVLAVTFLGAVGVSTAYFLLKREMAECEKQERNQLRDEILRELKESLPIKGSPSTELVIQR